MPTDGADVPTATPNLSRAFAGVTTLFFAWGFITAMIDPLIPAARAVFSLSYTESMLTQFAFFAAYGLVSLPAAALIARLGFASGIVLALAIMLLGCLGMVGAAGLARYEAVLAALFVIAAGITVLQVAANPLAAALGDPGRSHFRLTFAQAFNSLGTVLAPSLGAMIMLRGGLFAAGAGATAGRGETLAGIARSFALLAVLVAALAVLAALGRRRLASGGGPGAPSVAPALRSRWARLGAAAIFLYVGAEVSIGSVMINYLHQPDVLGVSLERAGQLLSLYWLGAMVGRFGGSALLTRLPAAGVVRGAALMASALCLVVSLAGGPIAAAAAIAVGLCNSILFPTIFTLTLERSSAPAAATSGLLCTAIIGGAILPPLVGSVADHAGLPRAFLVPAAAYVLIAAFGFLARAGAPDAVVATPRA
ncbi:MAG: MFS transporter [Proteobacteria bacterium]|nr:MFS transporter [Pseudomonadota bacterium]